VRTTLRSQQRKHGRNPAFIREQIAAAQTAQASISPGHTVAVAFAHVMGPRQAVTPSGEPILIGSGQFDLEAETPQEAIARAARRWHGIEIHLPHWDVVSQYALNAALAGTRGVPWQRLFYLRYTAEEKIRQHKGIVLTDPFESSWYLTDVTSN